MLSQPVLLCTVRNCGLALQPRGRTFVCERGHSFDVARGGYVNLLQPQDRRSRYPGDTPQAVAARRRLHDSGITMPLAQQMMSFLDEGPTGPLDERPAGPLDEGPTGPALDAGCGEGFYLSALSRHFGVKGCGVDIAIPAIELASRRYPDCEWLVANADRLIPYAPECFSLVLSITGRLNSAEFHRVLRPDGRLLVALAAPDDLTELRGDGRDRVANAFETFGAAFHLLRQGRASVAADLTSAQVDDVQHLIYRPRQEELMQAMRLTFSFDLLLFRPRMNVRRLQ